MSVSFEVLNSGFQGVVARRKTYTDLDFSFHSYVAISVHPVFYVLRMNGA